MFVIGFLGCWVIFLFCLNCLTVNVLVWWSSFLLITLIFSFLGKESVRCVGVLNYFVIQESLGLFFLVFRVRILQFLVVMIKVGVAPLHFWLFRVTNDLLG